MLFSTSREVLNVKYEGEYETLRDFTASLFHDSVVGVFQPVIQYRCVFSHVSPLSVRRKDL